MLPRSSLVPFVLGAAIVACGSGGDPSAGSEVGGVLVVPNNDNNGGSSNPYIDGVALGTAGAFVSTSTGQSCGNVSCGGTSGFALSFVPSTAQAVSFANSGSPQDVALSPNGSFFWGAPQAMAISTCTGFPGIALWSASATASEAQVPVWTTFPLVTPSSTGEGCGSSTNDEIVGIVADADAVYVAVAEIAATNGNGNVVSPDSPQWGQSNNNGGGGTPAPLHLPSQGLVFAVTCSSQPCNATVVPSAVATTFDPASAVHTLVYAGNDVCWIDASSQVTCAPTGWANATPPAPTVLAAPTLPSGWSLVAIAASGSTVAWAAAPDVGVGAAGCIVWQSAVGGKPTMVYDGSAAGFFCRGLAIDGQYAYLTTNAVYTYDEGSSCTNCTNGVYAAGVIGTGIARVPLAGGGALQTMPLESQEWYGPRRVFVDDTYIYAVDPSYVLRVEKTAFGP